MSQNRRQLPWWRTLTVEPVLFSMMTIGATTAVVDQAYFVHKACTVDVGYPAELCANLSSNLTAMAEVQTVVSTFTMFNELCFQVVPICLSLFMGAWSDRRGRKLLLLMGLAGKVWHLFALTVGSTQSTWSVYMVSLTGTFPASLLGYELAIHTSVYSYLSDVTSEKDRTFRLTLLQIFALLSSPVGLSLGALLFTTYGESFTLMYLTSFLGNLATFFYAFLCLEWATTPQQKPFRIFLNKSSKSETRDKNCCLDFFQPQGFSASVQVFFKKRPNRGRLVLLTVALCLLLCSFPREDAVISFLYTQLVFDWDVEQFSTFRIFASSLGVAGTLLSIPVAHKYLKLDDTTILMVGAVALGSGRFLFAVAKAPWLMYAGATLASIGPVCAPVLHSIASKVIPEDERGKVFILLSLADNTTILLCAFVFSRLYNATILTSPESVYWFSCATQVAVLLLAIIIKLGGWTRPKNQTNDEQSQPMNEENTL